MRFDHPDYEGVWFTVKENPTNRDVLMYDATVEGALREAMYARLWSGVRFLVVEWHCDLLNPDDPADKIMDGAADLRVVNVLKWAGLAVFSYRRSLEPEKN